ncbi:MAG: ATP synthase subunit I [Candidatus Aminicenantes bacterium]|nr:ATP synthase subunit I [Candidatus Aminicenantes bacterium]
MPETDSAPAGSGPAPLLGDDAALRRMPLEIVAVAAVLAVGGGILFGWRSGVFVLAGGGLSALTFAWLKTAVTRFLLQERRGALRRGVALYLLRLGLICLAFLTIILLFPKQIIAFAAGFSAVVLVLLREGWRAFSLLKTWKN